MAPTTTSVHPLPPTTLTDTMHLLDAPHVTGQAPTGHEPIRVAVPTRGVPVTIDAPPNANWTIPRPPELTTLAATIVFWVDVEGVVSNANPSDPCFWRVNLYSPDPNAGQGGGVVTTSNNDLCAAEPAVLAAGIRTLTFELPARNIPGNGETLRLIANANAILGPGATFEFLTGAVETDSTVTVLGLQLPVTTHTLL